ncbi:hypothetical protein K0M31_020371 [Melipona bicolor]|uniref:Uncharacterized protein n=1 Tax=Melipona bicolor TaxID=60889 RepID=A0AA40G209_9HYME|nr:hypothetical protein K0M31_020371 [Melipona bicolor]
MADKIRCFMERETMRSAKRRHSLRAFVKGVSGPAVPRGPRQTGSGIPHGKTPIKSAYFATTASLATVVFFADATAASPSPGDFAW